MATRKENLKGLFANSRTRIIILFTAALLIVAIVVGVSKLRGGDEIESGASAGISSAPGIQSIPGAIDPTVQYAKLQAEQNIQQAQQANTTGGSAIPTIIRRDSWCRNNIWCWYRNYYIF